MAATEIFVPEFVPNQVLTDGQLNQLRDYLDRQEHLTRIRLVGMGIVCGLNYDVRTAPEEILISAGLGITSDGFLIELGGTTYTHYRAYVDPDLEEDKQTPRYEPWQKHGDIAGQIDIIELLDTHIMASEDRPKDARSLTELRPKLNAKQRILVLYLEREPVDTGSCLVIDCNKKGLKINFNVRALLLNKEALDAIEISEKHVQLVRLPRLKKEVLEKINDAAGLNQAYGDLIKDSIDPLFKQIVAIFGDYEEFLHIRVVVEDSLRRLADAITDQGQINQYHYDILRDLADAYNEAATAACKLLMECCPVRDFPRHLMLGLTNGDTGKYRHIFMPSPIRNVMQDDLDRVRKLFGRIVAMAGSFNSELTRQSDIRLTPSHTERHPLGTRALPFYYDFEKMRDLWQPRVSCTPEELWSYYTAKDDRMRGARLDYAYPYASFIRIEGDLGQTAKAAGNAIAERRQKTNGEFALLLTHFHSPDPDWGARIEEVLKIEGERLHQFRKVSKEFPDLFKGELYNLQGEGRELVGAAQEIARLEHRLIESNEKWAQARCERQLYCNVAHLEADYVELRDRLLCVLQQLFGHLNKVIGVAIKVASRLAGDAKARALVLAEGIRTVASERILTALIAGSLANPANFEKELEKGLGREVLTWGYMIQDQPELAAPIALAAAAEAARLDIKVFSDFYLPQRLCELDFHVLNLGRRRIVGDVVRVILLCRSIEFLGAGQAASELTAPSYYWAKPSGSVLTADMGPIKVPATMEAQDWWPPTWPPAVQSVPPSPWPAAISECRDTLEDLLRVISECLQASLMATAIQYEYARTRDLGLFHNLVEAVDGIEHRAGVEKGGTFILLCDVDKDGKRTVCGDFSLAARPPCCCDHQETPLPPVAFTDYRVVQLPVDPKDYKSQTIELVIPLLEDAYDADFQWTEQNPEPPLTARLLDHEGKAVDKTETDLGGVVMLMDKELPGMVSYQIESKDLRAGQIDRFAYRIQRGSSEALADTAEVFILFLPKPGVELGSVRASVAFSDTGAPVEKADVRLIGTEMQGATDEKGEILFERVPSGKYQLQAVSENRASDVVDVEVSPGETVPATLIVPREAKLGTIRVHVRDKSGSSLSGIKVGLLRDNKLLQTAQTNADGFATFAGVMAGKYQVGAAPAGYLAKTADVDLSPGADLEVSLVLATKTYHVPPGFNDRVAEKKRIPIAAAEKLTRDSYDERYAARYAMLTEAAKDPVIQEMPVYAAAENFFSEVLTADVNDAKLAAAYKEVANNLSKSFAEAPPAQKQGLGELIAAVTLGLLDRMSLSNPETLGAEAHRLTQQLPRLLKGAVDSRTIAAQWDGEALSRDFALQSPEAIGKALTIRRR